MSAKSSQPNRFYRYGLRRVQSVVGGRSHVGAPQVTWFRFAFLAITTNDFTRWLVATSGSAVPATATVFSPARNTGPSELAI